MSDLDKAIRTPAEIRAWFVANAGTVTAGLVAERAVRAVLGLHDEVLVTLFDDAQPVCREDGQEYDGVDLPGCRTTRAIDAEINHVLRGVGVSGEDRSEPASAPREQSEARWKSSDRVDRPAWGWRGTVKDVVAERNRYLVRWDHLLDKPLSEGASWCTAEELSEVVSPEGTS